MSFASGSSLYSQNSGLHIESVEIPFYSNRAPSSSDTQNGFFPIGKRWIYTGVAEYVLLSFSSAGGVLSANWQQQVNNLSGTTIAMTGTPGSVTVSNSAIKASSIILYSRNVTGGTVGNVSITAQSSGSFTLTSTGNETSTFNYQILN